MFCSYIADCQIPKACFKFVEERGREILEKNLSRNFLIHLVNLFDFSLVRPEVVQRAYAMLENLRDSMGLALWRSLDSSNVGIWTKPSESEPKQFNGRISSV